MDRSVGASSQARDSTRVLVLKSRIRDERSNTYVIASSPVFLDSQHNETRYDYS